MVSKIMLQSKFQIIILNQNPFTSLHFFFKLNSEIIQSNQLLFFQNIFCVFQLNFTQLNLILCVSTVLFSKECINSVNARCNKLRPIIPLYTV
jgi:hypothetical protein